MALQQICGCCDSNAVIDVSAGFDRFGRRIYDSGLRQQQGIKPCMATGTVSTAQYRWVIDQGASSGNSGKAFGKT